MVCVFSIAAERADSALVQAVTTFLLVDGRCRRQGTSKLFIVQGLAPALGVLPHAVIGDCRRA
jgi:hypothetical protein